MAAQDCPCHGNCYHNAECTCAEACDCASMNGPCYLVDDSIKAFPESVPDIEPWEDQEVMADMFPKAFDDRDEVEEVEEVDEVEENKLVSHEYLLNQILSHAIPNRVLEDGWMEFIIAGTHEKDEDKCAIIARCTEIVAPDYDPSAGPKYKYEIKSFVDLVY